MGKDKNIYEQPHILNMEVEEQLMTTYSGQHTPGSNNGQVGDAKQNTFFFDDEEDEGDESNGI
jgi:hypothetical protein